ncbi:hypothetical protein C8R47DRAFT_972377 [Mycena vitilis]|nr:hypothetical protein C8R47DRAFT_972377 [Mycena vitilis]
MGSWTLRTDKGCRRWANKYRLAATARDAQHYFDRSGLRWTEFMRLPYFDLPTMLVIDSMHNLFLGLLKEHFRGILGFRPIKIPPQPDPDPVLDIDLTPTEDNPLPTRENEIKSLNKALHVLRQPMSDALKTVEGRQEISMLSRFRSLHRAMQTEKIVPPSPVETTPLVGAITEDEKKALWADIAAMVKPSWMTSVPPQFGGESSDGKLKADQWRTLGTVYMPITLIRLWAASEEGSDRRALLSLTMDLVSAVIILSSRKTSVANAQQAVQHLLSYRSQLSQLFPDYVCHPNHHMAMHIPEFLLLFGPVHGWWTFPLERLIGKLQRVPTNYKPGNTEHQPLLHAN